MSAKYFLSNKLQLKGPKGPPLRLHGVVHYTNGCHHPGFSIRIRVGKTSEVGSEGTTQAKGMTLGLGGTGADLDAVVLPDSTATSGVSVAEACPNHMS